MPITSRDLEAALVSSGSGGSCTHPADLGRRSRMDTLKSAASRIMHHEFYRWFYVWCALLSAAALVISFWHKCDSRPYLLFEVLINSALIVEVLIRIAALQEHFWTSWFNLFDIFVLATCLVTLLLMPAECSDAELRLDAVVLVVRNVLQFARLYTVVDKGRRHSRISGDATNLSFDTRPPPLLPSRKFGAQTKL